MNDRDDLDWLAFRYAAGELDAADTRAFERRLARDQSAREAVARADAMAQCVVAVESLRAPEGRRRTTAGWRGRDAAAAAVGLAACLLMALAAFRLPRPEGCVESAAGPVRGPAGTDQLAVIWSATRQPFDDPLGPPEQLDEEGSEGPVASADLWSDGELTYWIEAAVHGLAAEESPDM